jgi:cephalosporin hydroxylase
VAKPQAPTEPPSFGPQHGPLVRALRPASLSALARTARLDPRRFRRNVEIAREVRRRHAIQKVTELAPALAFFRRRPLRTVVEIGTFLGGTLWGWCQIAEPDAVLVSIDLPGAMLNLPSEPIEELARLARERQQLHCLRSDSHDPATVEELRRLLGERQIDLLMIDGDHSFEGVKADFELYSPLVAPGGFVAFHDILTHQDRRAEVDRFWREVRARYPHVEFTDPGDDWGFGVWGGIGVLELLARPRRESG